MAAKIVKVIRPIVSYDGKWRVYDQDHLHDEQIDPDEWLRACMGARNFFYAMAVWSVDDGWQFKRRLSVNYHW